MERQPDRPLSGWYLAFWEDRINEFEIPGRDAMLTFLTEYATNTDIEALNAYIHAVDALNALPSFRAMRAHSVLPHSAERHCVRCHATYTEATNKAEACTIPHVYGAKAQYRGWLNGARKYEFTALCCKDVTITEQGKGTRRWVAAPEPCFRGRHTDNVEEVEMAYNHISILQCEMGEDGECKREHKARDLADPPLIDDGQAA